MTQSTLVSEARRTIVTLAAKYVWDLKHKVASEADTGAASMTWYMRMASSRYEAIAAHESDDTDEKHGLGRKTLPAGDPKFGLTATSAVWISRKSLRTSAQIRAARALVRWTAVELAREAVVGGNTIRRAEMAEDQTSLTLANEAAIRHAFARAGVQFIEANGGGPGVRLSSRNEPK